MSTDNKSELKDALKKDFRELYTNNGTSHPDAKRLMREADIEAMTIDNLTKFLQAHDTKLYEQVMSAIGKKPSRPMPGTLTMDGDTRITGDLSVILIDEEVRTAINKIFNKEQS